MYPYVYVIYVKLQERKVIEEIPVLQVLKEIQVIFKFAWFITLHLTLNQFTQEHLDLQEVRIY